MGKAESSAGTSLLSQPRSLLQLLLLLLLLLPPEQGLHWRAVQKVAQAARSTVEAGQGGDLHWRAAALLASSTEQAPWSWMWP